MLLKCTCWGLQLPSETTRGSLLLTYTPQSAPLCRDAQILVLIFNHLIPLLHAAFMAMQSKFSIISAIQ